MKTKFLTLIMIFGIIGITLSSNAMNGNACVELAFDINEFSGFSSYHDTGLVTSTINSSMIDMVHNDEAGSYEWETMYYGFGEDENYTDFNILVEFDYSYTGSMLMQSTFAIGSFWFENGTFDEASPNGYRRICSVGIWDAWAGSGGRYYVSARPYHVEQQYETVSGTLSSSGTLQYNLTRNNGTLTIQILKNNDIQIEHQYTVGVSRPLNYLYIAMSIDPTYCTYTQVTFTSIQADIYKPKTRSFWLPTQAIYLSLLVSFGVLIFIRRIRRN
jgi:hypothetical protein